MRFVIRHKRYILLLCLLWCLPAGAGPSEQEVLKQVMERIKKNDEAADNYGYTYQAIYRNLDDDGRVTKEEKRLYRIVWLEDKAYFELEKVDDRELNSKEQSEELKRRNAFIKSVKNKEPPELKMKWDELFAKYDYSFTPKEGDAAYVISFQPKKTDLPERSRMEKVFNKIAGKVWINTDYNVLKANVWLADNVRFGLGILGKLDELQLHYTQQTFEGTIWLPATLRLTYNVRVLLKSSRQQMESRFYDIYRRPGIPAAVSGK